MSYTSDLAALKRRIDEIDQNTISHLDRILDNLKTLIERPVLITPTPPPLPPVVRPPDQPPVDPRMEDVRQAISGMSLAGAGSWMMQQYYAGYTDKADFAAQVINDRWPSEWRTGLPKNQSGYAWAWLHSQGLIPDENPPR